MPYTRSWNESTPAGSSPANSIDNSIRDLKLDVRERVNSLIGNNIADPLTDPVIAAENTLLGLRDAIDTLEAAVPDSSVTDAIQAELDALELIVIDDISDLAALDARVTTAEGDIDTLEADLATLDGTVVALDAEITPLRGGVTRILTIPARHARVYVSGGNEYGTIYVNMSVNIDLDSTGNGIIAFPLTAIPAGSTVQSLVAYSAYNMTAASNVVWRFASYNIATGTRTVIDTRTRTGVSGLGTDPWDLTDTLLDETLGYAIEAEVNTVSSESFESFGIQVTYQSPALI